MLHRRQFIISPKPAAPVDGWQAVPLEGGWILSHCPALPVHSVTDRAGTVWTLIGLCWETEPAGPAPAAAIAAHNDGPVEDLYRSWVGRWVLVGRNELHLDATGTLGVLYLADSAARSTGPWVSSSPALLAWELKPGAQPVFEIAHRGMDWYPAPGARLSGLRRLLPTQILLMDCLAAGKLCVRPRSLRIDPAPAADLGAILDGLQRYLIDAVRAVAADRDRVYLPLTGGQDSRLILAAAHAAGNALETYTFVMTLRRHGTALSRADREIPSRLAAAIGVPHHLIRGRRPNAARIAAWRFHTAGHSVGVDEHQLAAGQWDVLPSGALVLRGGVFELGRCYYHRGLRNLRSTDDPEAITKIVENFALARHFASATHHTATLREWLEWCKAYPAEGLDIRDRFYLDQRVGAWLSSIEQGLDLTTAERVHIANSYRFIESVLSLPEAVRAEGRHQPDLIARMAPVLAAFPINPPNSLARRAVNHLLKRAPQKKLWVDVGSGRAPSA